MLSTCRAPVRRENVLSEHLIGIENANERTEREECGDGSRDKKVVTTCRFYGQIVRVSNATHLRQLVHVRRRQLFSF